MIGGIIGDVIGSVYEGYQWQTKELELIQQDVVSKNKNIEPLLKNTKWVREQPSWTDDTLCSLALYSAYISKTSPSKTLQSLCLKYQNESIGFGKGFKLWLQDTKPYNSCGNGAIMRIGFIPFLNLSLKEQKILAIDYTNISHNHSRSIETVLDYLNFTDILKRINNRELLDRLINKFLLINNYNKTLEELHQERCFEMDVRQTFFQSLVILNNSYSFEDCLRNAFYVGGDSDTLASIVGVFASIFYETPIHLETYSLETLKPFPELYDLAIHFKKTFT